MTYLECNKYKRMGGGRVDRVEGGGKQERHPCRGRGRLHPLMAKSGAISLMCEGRNTLTIIPAIGDQCAGLGHR